MKGEELKHILNKVKLEKKLSFSKIADLAGVDRGILSSLMNKDKGKTVTENMVFKLSTAFPDHFPIKSTKQTSFTPPNDEILTDRAMLKVIVSEVAKLQAAVYGRNLKDCFQELENSTILLVEQMKRDLKK